MSTLLKPPLLTISLTVLLLLTLPVPLLAATLYVDATHGSNSYDGLAPQFDGTHGPKDDIDGALGLAQNDDTIIVAPGTYTEYDTIEIGGYGYELQAITIRSQDPTDPAIVAATIIDGQYDHRIFDFADGGPDSNYVLSGFTIVNGYFNTRGGGFRCSNSNLLVSHCVITKCEGEDGGGGVYCNHARVTFEHCTISDNTCYPDSSYGHGLVLRASNVTMTGCTVTGNQEGGIYGYPDFNTEELTVLEIADSEICDNFGNGISSDVLTITNSIIRNNSSGGIYAGYLVAENCIFEGNFNGPAVQSNFSTILDSTFRNHPDGALRLEDADSVWIENCLFQNNHNFSGGAVHAFTNTFLYLLNCSFFANRADDFGGAVYLENNCTATLDNCLFVDNQADKGGGLACVNQSEALLTHATFHRNSAANRGGAIRVHDRSELYLNNSILWGNSALEGAELAVTSSTAPSYIYVTTSDIADQANSRYWQAPSSIGWSLENLSEDPRFLVPGSDYRLAHDSPCIDAATAAPFGGLPLTDHDGQPRILDGNGDGQARPDMGAYEMTFGASLLGVSTDRFEYQLPLGQLPPADQTFILRNAGPNPLNWQIASDCDWLTVSPASGGFLDPSVEITLTFDLDDLPPYLYQAQLTISAPDALNSPVIIPVTLLLYTPDQLYVPQFYPTIQAALDAAQDGDSVIISPGTYTGPGNRDLDFLGKLITVRSLNPDDPDIVAQTVINCNGTSQEPHRGFHFHTNEDPNSILSGLTITNGYVYGDDLAGCGGAILCDDAAPSISNCRLLHNSAQHPDIFTTNGYDTGSAVYGSNGSITNCIISRNDSNGGGSALAQCQGPITNCSISENSGGVSINGRSGAAIFNCDGPITGCTINSNSDGGLYDCDGPIIGCTISYNTGNMYGGGLTYCKGLISDCIITHNSAEFGGGISGYCMNCDPWAQPPLGISHCLISENSADRWGGGIFWYGGPITNCVIRKNRAWEAGGGIKGASPVSNCIITENCSYGEGGGLHGCPTVKNSVIAANTAGTYGGGGYLCNFTDNCTIIDNIAGHAGGGLYLATRLFTNSIFWNNSAPLGPQIGTGEAKYILDIRYCNIQGLTAGINQEPNLVLTWGPGNIDLDPCFVAPGGWNDNGTPQISDDDFWVPGDYHLRSAAARWDIQTQSWLADPVTSRCIDAGSPASPLADEPLTVPGLPAGPNRRVNLGAYGATAFASLPPADWSLFADLTNDGRTDLADLLALAESWLDTAGRHAPFYFPDYIPAADLNQDGTTNLPDLALLAADWLTQTSWHTP